MSDHSDRSHLRSLIRKIKAYPWLCTTTLPLIPLTKELLPDFSLFSHPQQLFFILTFDWWLGLLLHWGSIGIQNRFRLLPLYQIHQPTCVWTIHAYSTFAPKIADELPVFNTPGDADHKPPVLSQDLCMWSLRSFCYFIEYSFYLIFYILIFIYCSIFHYKNSNKQNFPRHKPSPIAPFTTTFQELLISLVLLLSIVHASGWKHLPVLRTYFP